MANDVPDKAHQFPGYGHGRLLGVLARLQQGAVAAAQPVRCKYSNELYDIVI